MQRLHQGDPTGLFLERAEKGLPIIHISLPDRLVEGDERVRVVPAGLARYYRDGLLDPVRLPHRVLDALRIDMGDYAYSAQFQMAPVPPGGRMFRDEKLVYVEPGELRPCPPGQVRQTIRYWDHAATRDDGAYTVGLKMSRLDEAHTDRLGVHWLIEDVVRGQWDTADRNRVQRRTAERDGKSVPIYIEQEPGSSGKDALQAAISNLSGFVARGDLPSGDKSVRAEPLAGQVNIGNVGVLRAGWTDVLIDEMIHFPHGRYKDQVDAASAAFNLMNPVGKRRARVL
jgi:predicted phage terminase large subunit-like protein